MKWQQVKALCYRAPLPRSEKAVLNRLADAARDNGENAYPAVPTIAHDTGLSPRTVQRALRTLQAQRVITETAPARGGRGVAGRPATYRIEVERILALLEQATLDAMEKGDIVTPISPEDDEPDPEKRVTLTTEKGDNHDRKGCHPDAPTIGTIEPTLSQVRPEGPRQREMRLLGVVPPPDETAQAVRLFNETAERVGLKPCPRPTRRQQIAVSACLRAAGGLEAWAEAVEAIPRSRFLMGHTAQEGWEGCTLDFLTIPLRIEQMRSGKYADWSNQNGEGGMKTDPYDVLALLAVPMAYAHPEKGGKTLYVRAPAKGGGWKRTGTIPMAVVKQMTEEGGLLAWKSDTTPSGAKLLRVLITEAGRQRYRELLRERAAS